MPKITIISIATGKYLAFWIQMLESFLKLANNAEEFAFLVLTDNQENISDSLKNVSHLDLKFVKIKAEKWPFPTLLRYEYILRIQDLIATEYVMYLDADMLFVGNLKYEDLINDLEGHEIGLILHPGFFRPNKMKLLKLYTKNPRLFLVDLKSKFLNGGLGSWERRKLSTAFVPRMKRKLYVCGGMWYGKRTAILQMCADLKNRVDIDLKNGIIATFHDESHLNSFFSKQKGIKTIDPKYCYDPKYPNLKNIIPYIQAVDKNESTQWPRD